MCSIKDQNEREQLELEGKNVVSDIMVPLWSLQTYCAIIKHRIDDFRKRQHRLLNKHTCVSGCRNILAMPDISTMRKQYDEKNRIKAKFGNIHIIPRGGTLHFF